MAIEIAMYTGSKIIRLAFLRLMIYLVVVEVDLHLKSNSEFAEFGISSVTNVKTKTCRKVFLCAAFVQRVSQFA